MVAKQAPVLILDFGSQYTQLIVRRVRAAGIYSELLPWHVSLRALKARRPAAIILSGGPASVNKNKAPTVPAALFELPIPILGICYGLYLLVRHYGGKIGLGTAGEYGAAELCQAGGLQARARASTNSLLYAGLPKRFRVWMSHGDNIEQLPPGFAVTAVSANKAQPLIASLEAAKLKRYGLQFHPEVAHTEHGTRLINNFLKRVAHLQATWSLADFLTATERQLRVATRGREVTAAVSGGVDSTVLAMLLARVCKRRLRLVFIDNGLLRMGEAEEVRRMFDEQLGLKLSVIDASADFLNALRGVRAPQTKRRIIGRIFVKVFLRELKTLDLLAQGTLYPDVIESVSTGGPSDTIKTHHNRVPEILKLMQAGRVLEPFKELFKDEVRELGKQLGIPQGILQRHPFPGPGLAVRILGAVTPARLALLRAADAIFQAELKRSGLAEKTWQAFTVLLPVRSVGVAGDKRRYGYTIVLRLVSSSDGMTADCYIPPQDFLHTVAGRITGELAKITRVTLDLSSKPPATIEWE